MYLVCGEVLFDFFQDGPATNAAARYDARIGGSPFTVAMGLARLGTGAALLSGVSNDLFGERISCCLSEEGIAQWAIVRKPNPTTLSFVGLDSQGSPRYAFFGDGASDRSIEIDELPQIPDTVKGLHFGSFSLVTPPTSLSLFALLEREKNRFISLDPNVRPTVEPDMSVWEAKITAILPLADLVKVSLEDLEMLYPDADPAVVARKWLEMGPKLIVVTDGGKEATGFMQDVECRVPVKPVNIADTVGAGDTFMATLLFLLGQSGDPGEFLERLEVSELERILVICNHAASLTCTRMGADLPRLEELQPLISTT